MMTRGLKVRVLKTARGCGFISKPGTVLKEGDEVEAETNPCGAISGLCKNGEWLGLYPGEFEFISAPDWVLKIWVKHDDYPSGESALNLLLKNKPVVPE
jgi:hypothetical protein